MRRAPIVIAGTAAGLAGVLTFHTHPASLSLSTTPAPAASARAGSGGTARGQRAGTQSGATARSGKSSQSSRSSGQAGATRTAVGPLVNYSWGVLSVKVTVSGRKIVKVGIGSLNDGGNPRSQYIDQQSIPLLEQQAMQAQSANIQGVSGASYTSAGFARSLQGALHSLGIA